MTELGTHLLTVLHAAHPCPAGHRAERMDVYTAAVRWECGAVRALPPMRRDKWEDERP